MSEDNIKEFFIPFRDLIKESLIRDIIIFTFIFILINTQGWDNIFVLLFPLITFGFSLFFRTINTNKWRTEFDNSIIIYNPLGLEKKHANRLFFTTLLQLILIFWIGAESLYSPHLVEGYYFYFVLLLFFLFSSGFLWIFIDVWKYSRIEIITGEEVNQNFLIHKSNNSIKSKNVLSFPNIKNFRNISILNFLVFLILNIINLILTFLILNIPTLGIPINLPGSGIISSEPLKISILFHILLIISPALTVGSLVLNYRDIIRFTKEDLDHIIKAYPPNIQLQINENLKGLSEKIKEQMENE
jgi:hypothetical protein